MEQWRQCNHQIQFKRHCLSALSKESLRKICIQELSNKSGVSCREHVLKEIERSFSLNDEPEVVEELTALRELEVLETAGTLIRPLKKRITSWLVLVDICSQFQTIEDQAFHASNPMQKLIALA